MKAKMLFNLRGSGGSGKSYVAHKLLGLLSNREDIPRPTGKRTEATIGKLHGARFAVLGGYDNACGGLDGVGTIAEQLDLIRKYADTCDVVFYEGLLVGKAVGAIGAAMLPHRRRHVAAFLDTPIDVCIERVIQRRLAGGNVKPLDPKNLRLDHLALMRCRVNAANFGLHCVDIPYQHAMRATNNILSKWRTYYAD